MKTYSIRQILFLIVFVLVIPGGLIATGFSVKAYYDGRDKATAAALQTAHAMTLVVERELAGLRSAAEALAFSNFLQTGDLAAFHAQARQVLSTTSGFAFVLTDHTGQQLVNTLKPYGSQLPHAGSVDALTRVFATAKPVISDLYLGGVTKKPVISISVPIIKNGQVEYVLDIGVWPEEFAKILLAQNIPTDWIVPIFDSTGTIVARNTASDQFVGKKGAQDLLREIAIKPEGIIGINTLEGTPAYAVYSRSPTTGWAVAIAVPSASINANLWNTLWWLIGGAFGLLLLGILIARYAASYLTGAIRTLGLQAVALGHGETLVMPPVVLKEAADLLTELAKKNEVLIRSEREKKQAEDALLESEQRYAAMFAKTPQSMSLIKLPEGTIVSVNEAFTRLFDCTQDEAVGKTSRELGLIDANSRAHIEKTLRRRGSIHNFECAGHKRNGDIVELSINVDLVLIGETKFVLTTIQDVTDIHAAQRERESLAAIVDFAKDAIIGTKLDGIVTSWNKGAELLFGYKAAEAIGKTLLELIIPIEEGPEQATILATILRGESVSNFSTLRSHKNGEKIEVSVAASPIRNSLGVIVGSARTVRDMTAEVAINKKLQESERLLNIALDERTSERDRLEQRVLERTAELVSSLEFNQAILLHSPIPMGVYNSVGQCVLVNQAYADMAGTTREILLADNPTHTAAMRQKGLLDDTPSGALKGKNNRRELHIVSTFGKEVWVEYNTVPAYLNNERHLLVQCFDLSERREAEEKLRVIATAFESQQAMMITDADKVILRVNSAFTDSTGYSAEEVVGQTPSVFRTGRQDARFYEAMWEHIGRDDSWHGEIWDQRKNGHFFANWMTITAVRNGSGIIANYVVTQIDITARKRAEEEIRLLGFFDTLTNLPNRRQFMDLLKQALGASLRSGRFGALMLIDLDNFKTLNDTLGHDLGDALLRQVTERLPSCVRGGDTVARLGGDEFIVMLEDLSEESELAEVQAGIVGEKILEVLNQIYSLDGHTHRSTASVGVTMFSGQQLSIEELLKRADLAMYQAKSAGRNTLCFFEPQMQVSITAQAEMEAQLHSALDRGEFILYYQPLVDNQRDVIGVEALVRWNHPQRGLVPPFEFIPVAEESGLIVPIGSWVLETACKQLTAWASDPSTAALTIAVNVSGRQFLRPDFAAHVLDVLKRTGANPHRLKLEITESLLLDDVDGVISKMATLRKHGVGFSLDDFGTGYSSLSYLKLLPLDHLKIDRSFVRDVLIDPNDAAIAQTILALGKTLGLSVIAEGVEDEAQWEFLSENGCDAYQGFLFSRPQPIEALEKLLGKSQWHAVPL
jgi:diguanylate cyclase (GGDEF)-like protein/PAS domain S-box-containing protein